MQLSPFCVRYSRLALLTLAGFLVTSAFLGCGGTDAEPARPATGERSVLFYRHPMNPGVTSPVPAKDEMGMDYVAVYADETGGEAPSVPGLATVEASSSGIRLAGVRTAVATRELLARSARTVGLVLADERRVRHVHTKIAGWVETLYVNYTGQQVRRGQPILAIYSPELLASQEEYLRARQAATRFASSTIAEVRRGGEDLVASSRRRLELFDVPQSLLATLERTGQAQRTVTLVAPASGFVSTKQVLEGMEVGPGVELFTLTDLSQVWVEAEFFENEARFLRLGQVAEIQLPYDPGHVMRGEVAFIYPTLSADSRTLKVRIELANLDGHLKPGMFVDVIGSLESTEGITVPEDAVIDTGLRQIIFVEREPGTFEPREVQIGIRGSGRVVISAGIREGERVATRANFLLDSESKLRASLQAALPSPITSGPPPATAPPSHQH
jgi:membrane fusion protein, copper/silver efflux system